MTLCRFTLIAFLYAIWPLRKYFTVETFLTGCSASDGFTPLGVKLSLGTHLVSVANHPGVTPGFAAQLNYLTLSLQNTVMAKCPEVT